MSDKELYELLTEYLALNPNNMNKEAKEAYYTLNDYIKDLCKNNQQLKQQLEEEKNIRNKAIEYIKPLITEREDKVCYPINWYVKDVLLQILQNKE